MSTAFAPLVDREHPWPGLAAFDETAQQFFNGRTHESAELRRLVLQAPLTVLFGKSGLGKSSLLQAGLFPLLRADHIFPVYVRLDVRDRRAPLIDQMRDKLSAEISAHAVETSGGHRDESLWEYLHRADVELWSQQNYLLTPLFVLDQFEEIFTLGSEHPEEIARFRTDLGDLIENRIPAELAARIEQSETAAAALDLRAQRYKVLVSFREDFLPALEGWKRELPSIMRNRLRLLPMSSERAHEAVHVTAPHLVDAALAHEIVRFVAAAQQEGGPAAALQADTMSGVEVEPALLSLVCHGLNERRLTQKKSTLDRALLHGTGQAIVSDFYRRALADIPERTHRFIENELITERGFRKPCDVDDARTVHGVTDAEINLLVDRRLLRKEPYHGTERVELTHDLLTRVVRDHRELERERDRVRRQRRRLLLLGTGMALLVAVSVGFALLFVRAERLREAAELAAIDAERMREDAEIAATDAERQRRLADESAADAEAQRQRAVEAAARVRAARDSERTQREYAEAQRKDAVAQRDRAEHQSRLALARQRLAQADAEFTAGYDSLVRSTLLAIESLRASWTPDAHELLVLRNSILPPRPERRWRAHDAGVSAIALGKRWLVTQSRTGTAVWDTEGWGLVARMGGPHGSPYDDVALSDDGRWIAGTCGWTAWCVWEAGAWDTPRMIREGQQHPSFSFSPDGYRLAVKAREKDTLDIYDTSTWERYASFAAPGAVAVAWSPNGRWLTTSGSGVIRLLDSERNYQEAARTPSETGPGLYFNPAGVLLQDAGGFPRLWEIDAPQGPDQRPALSPLGGDRRFVRSSTPSLRQAFALSADSKFVATPDGLYSAATGTGLLRLPALPRVAMFLPGERTLLFGQDDGMIELVSFDRREAARLDLAAVPTSVDFSSDGRYLAVAHDDGVIRLFDPVTLTPTHRLQAGGPVSSVRFCPGAKWLLGVSKQGVTVFSVRGWQRLAHIVHEDSIEGIGCTETMIVSRAGKRVSLVHLSQAGRTTTLNHDDHVENVSLSPDGAWVKTRTTPLFKRGEGVVRPTISTLWSAADGRRMARRSHGRDDLAAQGNYTLGPQYETELLEGDSAALQQLSSPTLEFTAIAETMSLTTPASRLVWPSRKTVRGADLLDRYLEGAASYAHISKLKDGSVSSDGRRLATVGEDGTVRLWPLAADDLIAHVCQRLSRNLTQEEWGRLGADGHPRPHTCPNLPP